MLLNTTRGIMFSTILFLAILHSYVLGSIQFSVEDLERRLDMEGLKILDKMYKNEQKAKPPSSFKEIVRSVGSHANDVKVPGSASVSHPRHRRDADGQALKERHSRVRRDSSIALNKVRAAQQTGNREQLYLRTSEPYKKLEEMYDPSDIVPISLTFGPPYNVMEMPKMFAVANYRNHQGSYSSGVVILLYNETSNNFTVHQTLLEYAPFELESFSGELHPGTHKNFFAVAGFVDDDVDRGMSAERPGVSIYEISAPPLFKFQKIQTFPMQTVRAMKYAIIERTPHLIFGMYSHITRNGRDYSSPSNLLILRYHEMTNRFHFHSSLPGSGVTDIECFDIRGETFLTVANYRDNVGRLGVLSFVYKYNPRNRRFEMSQYLTTKGARDIEHFVLANEHYIVVANEASGYVNAKVMNVKSEVYKFNNGRFELIQKLETYGCVKWKSMAVPNCKQDVLLVYSDQRNNVDQIGVYTFSHDKERFSANQFSIYHLDNVNASFRPNVSALSFYSIENKETGDLSLYLIIGATDVSQGSNVYKLTYDVVLTDSPLDAFKREVEAKLKTLNETLHSVKALLATAKATVEDAVLKTDSRPITGTKTILGDMVVKGHATINLLNITTGTMMQVGADSDSSSTSLNNLVAMVKRQNNSASNIISNKHNYMRINQSQIATAKFEFQKMVANDVLVNNNVTVASDVVNNVSLSDIRDIVLKSEDSMIPGRKVFTGEISAVGNVDVVGKVNGMNMETDFVRQGVDQNITGSKTFSRSVKVLGHLNTGSINGIDVEKDVLLVDRSEVVLGSKTFDSNLTVGTLWSTHINGVDMGELFNDRLSKTANQNVTGYKVFNNVTSMKNVEVNGKVNDIDLKALSERLSEERNGSVIYGHKKFTGNVTILNSLTIDGHLNSLAFPSDVLLTNKPATISAPKVFNQPVSFHNLTVFGKMDGVALSEVVTVNSAANITGTKTFTDVTITGNVNVGNESLVNGIDLSKFVGDVVKTSDDGNMGDVSFSDAVHINNSTITTHINSDTVGSLKEFFHSCLHLNIRQNISTPVVIENNITVSGYLEARSINGYKFPDDFATTRGNQTFEGNYIFDADVHMDDANVTGLLNNIDVKKFSDTVITNNGGEIFGVKSIYGNVTVNGSFSSVGKINGLDVRQDILFYDIEQNITAEKVFHALDVGAHAVHVIGDLGVKTTIDGVDLSELELSGMSAVANETISGEMCFMKTDYNRSVDLINGVDLSALRDDIVTVHTDQVIKSKKTFQQMVGNKNLVTSSVINGVDVSLMRQQIVVDNEPSTVTGNVTFNRRLHVNGNMYTKKMNDVDMETLRHDFISLSNNVTLGNLSVIGEITANRLTVSEINGISIEEDVVYRSREQTVRGLKRFGNVVVDNLTVHGDVGGVDLEKLRDKVVFKNGNQTLNGLNTFLQDVVVDGDLTSGTINGINFSQWDLASTSKTGVQELRGLKTFTGETTIRNMIVNQFLNQQNFTELVDDAVLTHHSHTNLNNVTFTNGVVINGTLEVNMSNLHTVGVINGVDVLELDEGVLKRHGEQDINGDVTINSHLRVQNNTNVRGLVNGINLSQDIVTKNSSQTIKGWKEFRSITLTDDTNVGKLVNGINVTLFANDHLFRHHPDVQVVAGRMTFEKGVAMGDVTCAGLVDGLNVTASAFVSLHGEQNVSAHITLDEDFTCKHLDVQGNIAGVDLHELNRTRIVTSRNEVIQSDVIFKNDIDVIGSLIITKHVNGLDLYNFNRTSPAINETQLANLKTSVSTSLINQCRSLRYVKEALKATAYYFDYFVRRQSIFGYHIRHTESFTIEDQHFLAHSISSNDRSSSECTSSLVTRWNGTMLEDYQRLPTSGVYKMVFFRQQNESYLIVLNSRNMCPGINGLSQVYKWNSTSSIFVDFSTFSDIHARDAVIYQNGNLTLVVLSDLTNVTSLWELTMTGMRRYASLDSISDTAHVLKSGLSFYLAVASRSSSTSSHGFVHVYRIKNGAFIKVQSIPTKGASSLTSFTTGGDTYLVIANERAYSSGGSSTYHLSVDIYVKEGSSVTFVWYRSLPTYRAHQVKTFTISNFVYLSILHYHQSVSLWEFGHELGFRKVDEVQLDGARGLTHLTVNGKAFVFLSATRRPLLSESLMMEIRPQGPDPKKLNEAIDCQ